ncbi:MAG: hypothetical protein ABFS09_10095 [Thermodesulfobacteriota bacterium]
MKIRMKNGSVDIDGRSFSGSSISINNNGKVIVDGIEQDGQLVGNITVTVNGDAESIHNGSGDVYAKTVGNITTEDGDVTVEGDVSGSITTNSGDVRCNSVAGSVNSESGDILKR